MSGPNSNANSPSAAEPLTIFGTLPRYFPDVKKDEKLKTAEFLDASVGVVTLVEKFGKVFAPVIFDLNGNIKKIGDTFDRDKENYVCLEDMILRERNAGNLLVVDAVQWLRRGLHFISRFFQVVIEDSESGTRTQNLGPLCKAAYEETLERYHGWLGSQLFNILSRFTPNRDNLFRTFALDEPGKEEAVMRDLRNFTNKMSTCVQYLVLFYAEHQLETNDRV